MMKSNRESKSLCLWKSCLLFFLSGLGTFTTVGCASSTSTSVVLATNRREIPAYIETFNAIQDKYRVELRFSLETPVPISNEEPNPDLIISESIAGSETIRNFRTLDSLFFERKINSRDFYGEILALGRRNNRQHVLPISFDLPILIFNNSNPGRENEMFLLNLEDVQQIAASVNRVQGGQFTSMGFSPIWYPDFLLLIAKIFGADFRENPRRVLQFNSRNLTQALEFIEAWSETANGGPSNELRYKERYLTSPPYRQVSTGLAHYAFSTASAFFLLPESRRLDLDFRWVGHRGELYSVGSILYAGIPRNARNPRGAEAFLAWLFQPATQRMLLDASIEKFTHSFGLFSGFSSLREVNEREFPRLFPNLLGKIPPEEMLEFPPPVPYAWGELEEEVLIPYLFDQLLNIEGQATLEDRLSTWLLSQPAN